MVFFFFFGCDRCLKEVVGMAKVGCGSRRSEIVDRNGLKWVVGMAEVGHGDRRSKWVEVGVGMVEVGHGDRSGLKWVWVWLKWVTAWVMEI